MEKVNLEADRIPLLGAAMGDALGAGVEGGRALSIAIEEDVEGVGRRFFPYSPFEFGPGELTDDTQMAWAALCELRRGLPDVRVASGRREYAERVGLAYRAWYQSGPPDVGNATGGALRWETVDGGWQSWAGGTSAGNGSLMRATAPFTAGYRGDALLIAAALDSSLTHPDPRCVASCVWYSATLQSARRVDDSERMPDAMADGLAALESAPIEAWLEESAGSNRHAWQAFLSRWPAERAAVGEVVRAALRGDHVDCLRTPVAGWPTGFVLSTLGQAAWAAVQEGDAAATLRLAVLHGGRDADSIGAVAGGLVGARFGSRALEEWNPGLLRALRLGHHWLGEATAGAFLDLLAAR